MNLGHRAARARSTVAAGSAASTSTAFEVQEFRRPEFEVTAQRERGPALRRRARGRRRVDRRVLRGRRAARRRRLPGACSPTPGSFTPPNRDDFTFGDLDAVVGDRTLRSRREPTRRDVRRRAPTPSGSHRLRIDFLGVDPPRADAPCRPRRPSRTSTARPGPRPPTLLVHPRALYVGPEERAALRAARRAAARATRSSPTSTARRCAGRAVRRARGAARLGAGRAASGRRRRRTRRTARSTSGRGGRCAARSRRSEGGTYRVTATVDRRPGRGATRRQLRLWVAGGKTRRRAAGRAGEGHADPRQEGVPRGRDRGGAGAGAVRAGRGRADAAALGIVRHRALHA